MSRARLPLDGVRVLDLSYVFAVPYIGALMSDLGAQVIKIEAPHRLDPTRKGSFGPYLDNDPGPDPWDRSGAFHVLNRGKQAIALDLGQPQGREVFLKLLGGADVVLENFTPRVMKKWDLTWPQLEALRPGLIMLSNTGYGASGPWSDFPSQGTTLEATTGISRYTGYRGDKPWKAGQSYPDFLACWTGLTAIFAALVHRRKTGKGQWIDLGMYQVGTSLVAEPILQKQIDGTDMERIGNEDLEHVPSNVYRCRGDERWLTVTVSDDGQWHRLAALMGPEAMDARYASAAGRREHRQEVDALVSRWAASQDCEEAFWRLQGMGIAAGPVMNNRDLLRDPHLAARGFFEAVEHRPAIGVRQIPGRPYRFRRRELRIAGPAPQFGQHNREVLREMAGLDEARVDELVAAGIVAGRPTKPDSVRAIDLEHAMRLQIIQAVDR